METCETAEPQKRQATALDLVVPLSTLGALCGDDMAEGWFYLLPMIVEEAKKMIALEKR